MVALHTDPLEGVWHCTRSDHPVEYKWLSCQIYMLRKVELKEYLLKAVLVLLVLGLDLVREKLWDQILEEKLAAENFQLKFVL